MYYGHLWSKSIRFHWGLIHHRYSVDNLLLKIKKAKEII